MPDRTYVSLSPATIKGETVAASNLQPVLSQEEKEHKVRLILLRSLLSCGIVVLAGFCIRTHLSLMQGEQELYLAAMIFILVGLFWKRAYMNPVFQWLLLPFAFLIRFLGALIKHSTIAGLYGAIFLVVFAVCLIAWFVREPETQVSKQVELSDRADASRRPLSR
jgi:FtsH-binding integral membrane protein